MYLPDYMSNFERWKSKKRTEATYCNVPFNRNDDDDDDVDDLPLPPPPPPPQINYSLSDNDIFPDPPKDLTPPSSPGFNSLYDESFSTSSYATFRPQSSASTYDSESIYEPINPRSSSQMSNRSEYSSLSGASSLYSAGAYFPTRTRKGLNSNFNSMFGKPYRNFRTPETDVDHLTDLLVQSMENSNDVDFFGICHKCNETVLGEGSGCTAMNQVYHIKCFTCHICHRELEGLSFYSIDGKPYCEDDYLNTMEKCSVCEKPILDRILRATGKPYHPCCLTCIVCGKCLDGIPFTVDSSNRIHCIEDFHKKFAPRCCVCKKPIMPEPGQEGTVRVVALDRSFHINCYKCEDCGLVLSSEAEGQRCYPLDDHILCRRCNTIRVRRLTALT